MNITVLNFLDNLLDLIYPKRCMFCDEIIPFGYNEIICGNCDEFINYVEEPFCPKCGKTTHEENELCIDCQKTKHTYDKGISVFIYDGNIRNSILRFKYNNHKEYAKVYGKIMYDYFLMRNPFHADVILPVPMYYKKQKKRGYNQAELLAEEFSKRIGIEIYKDVLIRTKNTAAQSTLDFERRKENLKEAFKVEKNFLIKGKDIIIIDDIYTSGNTIEQCSSELIKAGAGKIYFFTLAVTLKK